MGKRLHLTLGDETWTAQVSANSVALEAGGESFAIEIEAVAGRLRAKSPAGERTGNAVVAGDSVWVTVEGEVFVFDTRRPYISAVVPSSPVFV